MSSNTTPQFIGNTITQQWGTYANITLAGAPTFTGNRVTDNRLGIDAPNLAGIDMQHNLIAKNGVLAHQPLARQVQRYGSF